jgi:hypothetical protein
MCRKSRHYLVLSVLFAVMDAVCPGVGRPALAGSSNTTLGVSLTILAGCSVHNEPGTAPVSVACDNAVPYRVELHPAMIEVISQNVAMGEHRHAEARNIVIVY